ncbi:unnamed protein product, partial [Mesorhabditis belari]|uniref:ShKT domain-containing protein n=1 Tax=Mesorhabditis belari TaxID=2138241 RepID=A0AAF3FDJ8_9BILA
MNTVFFSLCTVGIFFISQTSATCGTLAPKVANSNVKFGAGGPFFASCGAGQICYNFMGTDQCFNCADASGSCSNWNTNGLCASSFYTSQYKRSYCPRTCGLCSTLS